VITEGADRLKDGAKVTLPGDPAAGGAVDRQGGAANGARSVPQPAAVRRANVRAASARGSSAMMAVAGRAHRRSWVA
jgi:multidrug efflux system membrane fusion protein